MNDGLYIKITTCLKKKYINIAFYLQLGPYNSGNNSTLLFCLKSKHIIVFSDSIFTSQIYMYIIITKRLK